jgi:hypothetical protein
MRERGVGAGRWATSVVDAVRVAGWLYATGGAGPYLSIHARFPGATRVAIDAAVAAGDLVLVTSVRGCTMVVPSEDRGAAAAAGAAAFAPVIAKLEIPLHELEAVGASVRAALPVPRAAAALRALGRPLGADARKLGFTSTVPVVLRWLEGQGLVRRAPERLDGPLRWVATEPAMIREVLFVAGPLPPAPTLLLPFRDPWLDLPLEIDPRDADVQVLGWDNKPARLGTQASLHHHGIVRDGRLAGLWEWSGSKVVTRMFDGEDVDATALTAWIRTNLDDVRFYGPDRFREARLAVIR